MQLLHRARRGFLPWRGECAEHADDAADDGDVLAMRDDTEEHRDDRNNESHRHWKGQPDDPEQRNSPTVVCGPFPLITCTTCQTSVGTHLAGIIGVLTYGVGLLEAAVAEAVVVTRRTIGIVRVSTDR
jgi:hypothetical protein